MPPRTILLAALHTPPSHSSGARRPAGLTKHLTKLGHRVVVLTSTFSGSGPVPYAARTVRTRDLLTSRLNWRRANVDAIVAAGNAAELAPPSPIEDLVIPDVQLAAWTPFAVPRALRLAREEQVDAVITTGPPQSVHLVGAALKARLGIPWLLELRDGWTFENGRGGLASSPPAQWLEKAVVRRADAAIGISEPLARDLRERCGANGVLLSLAYDPEDMAAADALAADGGVDDLLTPGKVSLVYTGSITEADGASAAFLEGLRRLRERRADADRLEVVVAGAVRTDVRARAEELGLTGTVRFLGSLERVRALALQRAGDALLVLVAHAGTSILTNKTVEYLVAGRPLIVLGRGSEAGRLVEERGAGVVVGRTDPDGAAAALERLLDGRLPAPAPGATDDLSYPAIAQRVSQLVERALLR